MDGFDVITKKLANGVLLHTIADEKYKTEYLSVFASLPLSEESATYASLTARVLQRGSVNYPTMKALSRALDENYAATLGASAFKCGEKEVFSLNLVTVKERYALSGETVFKNCLEILEDMYKNPLLENGGFVSEYFEGERQNLIDAISAQINNKASYSRHRFLASMCEGEAFGVNGDGDIETAKKATSEALYAFYKNTVMNAPCDIFYVGEKSADEVASLIAPIFSDRNAKAPDECDIIYGKREVKRVCENMDIAQGHLWIGFRTGLTYNSPDYLAGVMFNMVLGGDVTGKMFMNLREKMSLCYTCHSSLDSAKGLLMAYAGIDVANAEVAEKAFFEQLEKIQNGEITDEEISDAKKSYANRMREILDNPSILPMWYFIRLGAWDVRDPARDAEDIDKITREDIVRISRTVELDTVYLLAGKGDKE